MAEEQKYGRRQGDIVMQNPLLNDVVKNMTDSQKINVEILSNLTSINTVINDIQHQQTEHHKLLVEGNGQPSLQERIRSLEAFVSGVRYWSRLVAGAIVLQAITFSLAAIIYFIKLAPILEKLSKP